MLLKKIKYHNFRPFIGDQEIVLTPDNDEGKNVIVVLGNNTFGKSTFVLSFIWCLYGESRFSRKDDILNKKVEAQMKFGQQEYAMVEVEFEDDNKCYTMTRTQQFTKGQNGYLNSDKSFAKLTYVTEKGETKSLGSSQAMINEVISAILPKDLSSFFFFEGEKNNEITRKDLGTSVRTLLGLEAFERMRTHLFGSSSQTSPAPSSVMGYYLEKQNDVSNDKAKAEYAKAIAAKQAIEQIDIRIDEINTNISSYEKSIEEINEILRQAAPSKELQRRRDTIARDLRDEEEELVANNKKILSLFSRSSLPLLITPFLTKVSSRLDEMDIADKGIKGIEATAIRELLARGECLCGTDLKPGTLAYKNVEKYIDYIPPKAVGTLVREMQDCITANDENAKNFISDFEELYKRIQKNKCKIAALETEDKEVLAEISAIGKVSTADAEENLSRYKRMISELREELSKKISEKTRRESERETAENNFNMYRSKSEKAKEYQLYYKYAQAMYYWVNKQYSEKEAQMRDRLNKYVTELFDNIYSGNRDIYIDDKYNINITVNGEIVDDTGGLRVIQYFAYVGGLVKLAYEVMQERTDEEGNAQELGEQYPLVLDAAFSHADQTHTQNIARELANATSQLIFAVMEKDWLYAKAGLTGKVSRIYELNKIDETEVQIVEVK